MTFFGKIENKKFIGKIDLSSFEGKKVVIEVTEHKRTRSDLQNRYYWGVVLKYLSDETGHTQEELHEIMKLRFLKPVAMIFNGVAYNIAPSTTKLNTGEFSTFIEQIRDFASAELSCYIPSPDEYYNEN